jgi:hypothetical protein
MLLGKVAPIQPPQVKHGNEVVRIVVGQEQEEFTIHTDLICAASELVQAAVDGNFIVQKVIFPKEDPQLFQLVCAASEFIQAKFDGNFIEGAEQKVTLPKEDPQLFQLVYDWLYSGRVADGVTTYLKNEDVCSGDIFWWKVYQMGDRLMMDRLRVLAVAKIQRFFTATKPFVPSKQFIEELYDDTKLPGLETYLVQHVLYWVERSSDVSVWSDLADAHMRFGQALAKASMLARGCDPVHPHVRTGVCGGEGGTDGDGDLSPWKIAGVQGEGEAGKHIGGGGGGREVRAKHMGEYLVHVPTFQYQVSLALTHRRSAS